jgi:hypothetical protein
MTAKNELEVVYYNFKPTTENNNTSSGINPNAIPARASNYTISDPAQTSAAAFAPGGAEAFTATAFWASTENGTTTAWLAFFGSGYQYGGFTKTTSYYVRAVRRVAV